MNEHTLEMVVRIGAQLIPIANVALPVVDALVRLLHASPAVVPGQVFTVEEVMAQIRDAQAAADRIEDAARKELNETPT